MRARIVRIGNSQGVRLPKPLLEQAGLAGDVELDVRNGTIVISRARKAREGWAEAARKMADGREDTLLDPPAPTRFDGDEWTW